MKYGTRTKRYLAIALSVILIMTLAVNLTACSSFITKVQAADLMKDIKPGDVGGRTVDDRFVDSTAEFSVALFKRAITEGENSLVCPLSVLLALAMTANGADGETLAQMEQVLGGEIPLDELNEYLNTYIGSLPSKDKSVLKIANSIWFRDDDLDVEEEFLQTNADYYGADAYKSAFDEQTIDDINNWVSRNTDGQIDEILDKIDPNAVMYLINAIVFDAKWDKKYKNDDVLNDYFHTQGGPVTVGFMSSEESTYLDDGKATGFVKPYAGGDYSFVALLPNEGVSLDDYITALTGGGFLNLMKTAQRASVTAVLPKFTYDYGINMNDLLKDLGMPDAFDEDAADFSRLGTSPNGNIYIEKAFQTTYIEVDELGTKAFAVTKFDMWSKSDDSTEYYVMLDRPFVYAIIDNATNLPVFIGTVMDPLAG